jgi:hypothetical protein
MSGEDILKAHEVIAIPMVSLLMQLAKSTVQGTAHSSQCIVSLIKMEIRPFPALYVENFSEILLKLSKNHGTVTSAAITFA